MRAHEVNFVWLISPSFFCSRERVPYEQLIRELYIGVFKYQDGVSVIAPLPFCEFPKFLVTCLAEAIEPRLLNIVN